MSLAIELLLSLIDKNVISVEGIEILMREVLDSLSYRLDAWLTSIASLRLEEMMSCSISIKTDLTSNALPFRRKCKYDPGTQALVFNGIMSETEKGILLERCAEEADKQAIERLFDQTQKNITFTGVYGWLEKPGAQGVEQKSEGYFQAPSLNQACHRSDLRSAALSEKDNEPGPFEINMSSQRVKKAMWFTEGLQNGFTPAELLGYEVERKLHDKQMDRYLLDLRQSYPLSGQAENEIIKNSRVIDGEKFIEGGKDNNIPPVKMNR